MRKKKTAAILPWVLSRTWKAFSGQSSFVFFFRVCTLYINSTVLSTTFLRALELNAVTPYFCFLEKEYRRGLSSELA